MRELVRGDVERARDFAAARNHDHLPEGGRDRGPLSAIEAPTLVVHGTADPMFPIEHGKALADIVPNAHLLPVEGAGHGVGPIDPETLADAILEHTAPITGRK